MWHRIISLANCGLIWKRKRKEVSTQNFQILFANNQKTLSLHGNNLFLSLQILNGIARYPLCAQRIHVVVKQTRKEKLCTIPFLVFSYHLNLYIASRFHQLFRVMPFHRTTGSLTTFVFYLFSFSFISGKKKKKRNLFFHHHCAIWQPFCRSYFLWMHNNSRKLFLSEWEG